MIQWCPPRVITGFFPNSKVGLSVADPNVQFGVFFGIQVLRGKKEMNVARNGRPGLERIYLKFVVNRVSVIVEFVIRWE